VRAVTIGDIERDCRAHFDVACERVLRIKAKDAALVPLRLNWPQRYAAERYLIPAFEAKQPLALLILKGRQDGLSTLGMAWAFHKVRWYQGTSVVAAAHQDDTVSNFRDMVTRFHDNLPPELQPPKDRYNRKEIHYLPPLDSSFRVRAAHYLDISRGKTPQIVILSEIAYYPAPDVIMSGVTEAVPDYGPTLILMESTAAGVDTWHHDLWKQIGRDAKRQQWSRRKWWRCFIPWYWAPDKRAEMPPRWDFPIEDREEFRDIQRRYALDDMQIMWYWSKYQEMLKTEGHVARRMLSQEQPCSPTEAFITGGECVFPEAAMRQLQTQIAEPIQGYEVKFTGTRRMALVPQPVREEPPLLVWEPPQRGSQYGIGVDVSRGVARDASAVVVVRMPGYHMAAHWLDTSTSTEELAYIVAAIADWYGRESGDLPIVCVELNDAGIHTNIELQQMAGFQRFQLYIWEYLDRVGATPVTAQSKTGWVTSISTKPIMLGVANSLLLAGRCTIPSAELQADMGRTQEIIRDGRLYGQTSGCDLTVAWLLALVTCWRKIQRLTWPGDRPPQPVERAPGRIPDVLVDRRGRELLRTPARSAWTAGDPAIDWRIQ